MCISLAKETKRQKKGFSTKPGANYYKSLAELMQMTGMTQLKIAAFLENPTDCVVSLTGSKASSNKSKTSLKRQATRLDMKPISI